MSNVFALQFIAIGVKNGFGTDSNTAGNENFMADLARLMPTNLVQLEREGQQAVLCNRPLYHTRT